MENIIAQIEDFLLKNAWGVITGGIIASLLGSVLCYLYKKAVEYLWKKFKIRKNRKRFINYTLEFYRGAAASYSKTCSYRQILLVGDYVIDFLSESLKILVYLIVTCIFINILDNLLLDLVLITICSFMLYPHFINLKEIEHAFKETYDYIFGKDFTQKCIEGAKETMEKHQDENKDKDNKVDKK